jgi:EmrB/QacA subfamily drug resistance transporter
VLSSGAMSLSATDAPGRAAPGSPWVIFTVCALGLYLTTLDLSIVNVAFPDIMSEFGISRADASWIVTSYNIFYGSLLVVTGKVADQLGRRRIFLGGLIVFAAGSLIAAIAPGLGVLIVGRAVQGIGGAMLAPASLGLLLAAFPPERRTQVVAMWGGVGALGIASGPSLGAFAISLTDWRAAFWINLPICLGMLIAGRRVLVETPRIRSSHRPDYGGALLITFALACIALGLSRSEVWGWGDGRTIGSLVVGVAAIPVFVRRQRRHPEPVLDLALFESRSFTIANASALVFMAAFAAYSLNNVLFLRQAWGYSVLTAGLLTALPPVTVAVLAPFTGRLAARIGFRPLLIVGPLIVAFATLGYSQLIGIDREPLRFVLIGEVVAIGIACFIPVNSAAAVAELPPLRLSIGGAVNNTFRQVGAVIGVALLVAILGSPTSIPELVDAHENGWLMISILSLLTAVIGLGQPGLRPAARAVAPVVATIVSAAPRVPSPQSTVTEEPLT